jgi:hypothetical protein
MSVLSEDLNQHRIFYSWQNDLPNEFNRYFIRKALKVANAQVEENLSAGSSVAVSITLDEATSNTPGSPYIPGKIVEKILLSDIFVADVSIINAESDCPRKQPNPNVTFELGFALATLGWDRIVLLFNTSSGNIKDLPFDFDRHRVSQYVSNVSQKSQSR